LDSQLNRKNMMAALQKAEAKKGEVKLILAPAACKK
jgi:hypothetical protein